MAKLTKLNRNTWPKYAREKLGVYKDRVWDLSHLWIYYSYRRKKVFEFLKKEANRTGFTLEYRLNPDKSYELEEFKRLYSLPVIEKAPRIYNTHNENYLFRGISVRPVIYDEIINGVRHICMVPEKCLLPIKNDDLLWENIYDEIVIPEPKSFGITKEDTELFVF